jgi:hypothetical protein
LKLDARFQYWHLTVRRTGVVVVVIDVVGRPEVGYDFAALVPRVLVSSFPQLVTVEATVWLSLIMGLEEGV